MSDILHSTKTLWRKHLTTVSRDTFSPGHVCLNSDVSGGQSAWRSGVVSGVFRPDLTLDSSSDTVPNSGPKPGSPDGPPCIQHISARRQRHEHGVSTCLLHGHEHVISVWLRSSYFTWEVLPFHTVTDLLDNTQAAGMMDSSWFMQNP